MPVGQLRFEVRPVVKSADFEEPVLHKAHPIFDTPLLVAAARRTELGGEAVVEGNLGEGVVPRDLAALTRDHDRLRVIEDAHEGHAPEGGEGGEQRPGQRLHQFVGNEFDMDPARPLQPSGEEVEHLDGPVVVANSHVTEVALAELARHALETDDRRGHDLAYGSNQTIDRVFPARVAALPKAAKNLDCREVRSFVEDLPDLRLEGRGDPRSAHGAGGGWLRRASLAQDPLYRVETGARLAQHRAHGQPSLSKDMDLVPLHLVVHLGPTSSGRRRRDGRSSPHGAPPSAQFLVYRLFREEASRELSEPTRGGDILTQVHLLSLLCRSPQAGPRSPCRPWGT